MSEIEPKLGFPPGALRTLEAHPRLVAARRGTPQRRLLVSTYFDTPDEALRRAGAALRIRRDGRRWIQTLKTAGTAVGGLHTREEAEWVVPTEALVTAHVAERLAAMTPPVPVARLRPAFTTRFRRTAFDVDIAGTVAEVAIDVGAVTGRGRTDPICEMEIELKSGDPAQLFDLAIALAADVPFTVHMPSKAERGYRLGRRVAAVPAKFVPPTLDRRMPARIAVGAAVSACLAHLQANEAGAALVDGPRVDPEFLHQLRVAGRRMRVGLGAATRLDPSLDAAAIAAIRDDLRWLFDEVGPAREADVWCGELLPRIAETFAGLREIDGLVRASRALRRADHERVRAALASPRYASFQLRVGRFVATCIASGQGAEAALSNEAGDAAGAAAPVPASPPSPSLGAVLPPLFARARKRLRKHAPLEASAEARHRTRIAAKKLRYAIELFGEATGKKKGRMRFVRRSAGLQRLLGSANDVAVAGRLLDRLAALPKPPGATAIAAARGWLAGFEAGVLAGLPSVWRRARRAKRFW